MKTIATILLATALVAGATQTFAKPAITVKAYHTDEQDRKLSGFSSVSVSGSFDVYLTQGSIESVKVEADADEIDKIVTEVDNGVLKIYTKRTTGLTWNWGGNKKRIVRVVAKDLHKIGLSGSGDVFFTDGFRTQDMVVSLSGSGDIKGKLDVKKLDVSIVGSGDISLSGRAETSAVKVSGSGDYKGSSLTTVSTSVRVVGSGDASVNVSGKLDASVAGSGDIRYTGGVKQISTSKAGSGDIHKF
ncbi:head GIN domain-containing protein [Mucilaginibacter terrae]|uniref:Putative auto-transporter adhesin head GIN domain-containing protein n=1 Tax=Mucilaginibacter terrae TaxID=1955052 RepID=A0ABU3GWU5_9SPHI|nr:head GIN domain-containing protein [Mucilaginibacter terrae]MDT3404223.1 hypothetical protein [Mucilaginibacter terrae]